MSKDNPRVWTETSRRSHGIVVSVKVEYRTERGTTVTATRTGRSANESESEMHSRLKQTAMADVRDTICKDELGHD